MQLPTRLPHHIDNKTINTKEFSEIQSIHTEHTSSFSKSPSPGLEALGCVPPIVAMPQ